jgi:hypothetical protein
VENQYNQMLIVAKTKKKKKLSLNAGKVKNSGKLRVAKSAAAMWDLNIVVLDKSEKPDFV